jgi:hypothetical protein
VQPGIHLLLNNLNSVDPEILWYGRTLYRLYTFWTAEALDQLSKECIMTGAGLAQADKSGVTVRTGEFNWQTSENCNVIASIEALLKSRG